MPDPTQDLLRQLVQQIGTQQAPQGIDTGLLAPNQQSFGDVFTNPDQSQVNALIGGLAGALNPRSGAPVIEGLAGAAQGFLGTRAQEAQQRQQEFKNRQTQLKNQIDSIVQLGSFGQAERRLQISEDAESRAVDKFSREVGGRTQVNVAIPDGEGGFITKAIQRDTQGNFEDLNGNRIQLPDGTRLATTGKTEADLKAGGLGLTTAQKGKTQERVLRAQKKLRTLEQISTDNLNKFLSTKGRGVRKIGTILDFAQGLGGETASGAIEAFSGVDPIEFAAESRTLFEDLENFFNEHRKDITGAAAAFVELEQLRKSVLSGELPPAQAMASLSSLINRVNADLEADFQALEGGVQRTSKQDTISEIQQLLKGL